MLMWLFHLESQAGVWHLGIHQVQAKTKATRCTDLHQNNSTSGLSSLLFQSFQLFFYPTRLVSLSKPKLERMKSVQITRTWYLCGFIGFLTNKKTKTLHLVMWRKWRISACSPISAACSNWLRTSSISTSSSTSACLFSSNCPITKPWANSECMSASLERGTRRSVGWRKSLKYWKLC